MLKIKDLNVLVEDKEVLKGVNLEFELGKNYALVGKNGSGKSSLGLSIMGNPKYKIKSGDILLDGKSIKDIPADQRSKMGIFLAFQNIPQIPGLKLFDFLKAVYNAHLEDLQHVNFLAFKKIIQPILDEIQIPKEFLFRDLNVGFSGGEKRKIEILQLKLLKPKYIILDEIDSGLDINSIKQLGSMLKDLDNKQNCFVIISHYFDILDYIDIDKVYVLGDGVVQAQGDKTMIKKLKEKGF